MATKGKEVGFGSCPICGRTALGKYGGTGQLTGIEGNGAIALKDGSYLCGSCVLKLRLMFPLQYTYNEKKHEVAKSDPLRELTTAEAIEANGQVVAFREDLREQYGFHNAVFTVESMAQVSGGLLKPPMVTVFGKVIYGSFRMMEEVTILSGGKETKAELEFVEEYEDRGPIGAEYIKNRLRLSDPGANTAENGYSCKLVVQAKGLALQPGDLIVKD